MKNFKTYNIATQYYKGTPLNIIVYTENHFARLKAKIYQIHLYELLF